MHFPPGTLLFCACLRPAGVKGCEALLLSHHGACAVLKRTDTLACGTSVYSCVSTWKRWLSCSWFCAPQANTQGFSIAQNSRQLACQSAPLGSLVATPSPDASAAPFHPLVTPASRHSGPFQPYLFHPLVTQMRQRMAAGMSCG